MSFPRYPEYKASGLEWLGEVPSHWKVSALGYRYDVSLGKMLDEKRVTAEHLKPYLRNVDVQWGGINTVDLPMMSFHPEESPRYSLQYGDLLVCEGGEVGRAAIWRGGLRECFYQKAVHRLRTRSPSADYATFLFYVLHSAVAQGAFEALGGKATIAHLPAETFRRQRFPFPPLAEQSTIAAFLDQETAKIDALVAEQERLINLLKEKRQAVISHAVTKGLNPDAPMKDSGIGWLGEMPEHWEVKRLSRITLDRCDGPFGSGLKSEHYCDEGVRVVRLQNIRGDGFNDKDAAFIDPLYYAEGLGGGHDVIAGDLLLAGLGDDNNVVGRACVAPEGIEPAIVKADCFRFRLNRQLASTEYVALQLTAGAVFDAGILSSGSTRSRISLSTMGSRSVALPPPA
jgi:type I restriction enzyme, S subunit